MPASSTVHVVGAGLAGLSCAVALVRGGRRVRVHEAAAQAGGRCRSFHDAALGRDIDNGNHLLLSGNWAVRAYLEAIDAADGLTGPERAALPFLDLASGERWTVRPGAGAIPWWIWQRGRRVPGTLPGDYLRGLRLALAGREATVAGCLAGGGPAFRRFWEPLAVAVLNTPAEDGAARLLWPVVRETFGRGEAACRPRFARRGLSPCFVDPALAWLERSGCAVELNRRLRSIELADAARLLRFAGDSLSLRHGECVVLAVPPLAAADLVPGLVVPERSNPIVNGHFRIDGVAPWGSPGGVPPALENAGGAPATPGGPPGGVAPALENTGGAPATPWGSPGGVPPALENAGGAPATPGGPPGGVPPALENTGGAPATPGGSPGGVPPALENTGGAPATPGVSMLGLIGGTSQWLFVRGDVASVTVSAASSLVNESAAVIAGRMWPEVAGALGLGNAPLPPHRIVKERRATFAQTPDQVARRPGTRTAWPNLFLAGDWTDTGLPATIEGAVRSGHAAAEAVLSLSTNS